MFTLPSMCETQFLKLGMRQRDVIDIRNLKSEEALLYRLLSTLIRTELCL